MEGDNAGEVLPGAQPIDAALLELKKRARVNVAAVKPVAAKPAAKGKPAQKR